MVDKVLAALERIVLRVLADSSDREERTAWDRYFASLTRSVNVQNAAGLADEMLEKRRCRFPRRQEELKS